MKRVIPLIVALMVSTVEGKPMKSGARTVHKRVGGAPLLVVQQPWPPVFSLRIEVDAGALTDPAGQEGRALLCWRTALVASRQRPRFALAKALEGLGARLELDVGRTSAVLELTGLSATFSEAVAVFAEVLTEPRFDASDLEQERRRVLADIAGGLEDDDALAHESALRFAYRGVPAGRAISGEAETLAKLNPKACSAWFQKAVSTAQVAIGVSGGVSAKQAHEVIGRHLPQLLKPRSAPVSLPKAKLSGRRLLLLDHPGRQQATIALMMPGVGPSDPNQDAFALADIALGGMFTSRLNYRIRDQRGWAYSLESFLLQGRSSGLWSAQWNVEASVAAQSLDLAMRIIELTARDGLTAEELRRCRGFLSKQPLYQRATARGELAGRMRDQRLGLPDLEFDAYTRRLEKLSLDDLKKALRQVLNPGAVAVVVIGDAKALGASLRAARSGFAVEVMPYTGAPNRSRLQGNQLRVTAPPVVPKPSGSGSSGRPQ